MDNILHQLGVKLDWSMTFTIFGLIMTRITMVSSTIPFLVGKPVPPIIRMGFAVVMSLFLFRYLVPDDPSLMPKNTLYIFMLFLKEMFYGAAIGIGGSILFYAFEAAGGIIDNQRGAAQARLLIPQLGEQSSLFGNLNYQLGIAIFLAMGGHLFFLKAVVESYDVLPLLTFPEVRPDFLIVAEDFIKTTGSILVLSLRLTAPILISIFVSDVVLGIMSKAAPSINASELGYAIRGVLGVFIYFIAFELIAFEMGKVSMGVSDVVNRIVRLLALSP